MPHIPRQQGHVVNHLRPWPNWPPQHCHWCHLGSNGGSWEPLGGWIIARQRFNLGWQNGRAQLHHMVQKWFAWNMEDDHFFRLSPHWANKLRTQYQPRLRSGNHPKSAGVCRGVFCAVCPQKIHEMETRFETRRVPWHSSFSGPHGCDEEWIWGGRSSQHWILLRSGAWNMFLPKWCNALRYASHFSGHNMADTAVYRIRGALSILVDGIYVLLWLRNSFKGEGEEAIANPYHRVVAHINKDVFL